LSVVSQRQRRGRVGMDALTDAEVQGQEPPEQPAILRVPETAWRVATADRAAVLIDAARDFPCLEDALCPAQSEICIAGGDFDPAIQLTPQSAEPRTLGELLRRLVEERPALQVRILVWGLGPLYGPGATLPLLLGEAWREHPRIQLRLDTGHPV